jgi:MtfA peptidase
LRADRPPNRIVARGVGLVLVAASGIGGGWAFGSAGAALGATVGILAAAVVSARIGRLAERRHALLALPFPEHWRDLLLARYDHYDRLPAEWRARFEDDVRVFLLEKRITGVETAATDEVRLLVAASAVTLSLGWPEYEWDQLTEVLLYPHEFDRDWSFESDELAGQAHPWGTVILSVPSLFESFEDPDDGYHVGIHEFAHLLDVDRTRFDGIPVGLDAAQVRVWIELRDKEMERLRKGNSVLDPYGASDPVEFLGVAVESFFELPQALRQRHRELYALLADYFRQDPAAWDDARGLAFSR